MPLTQEGRHAGLPECKACSSAAREGRDTQPMAPHRHPKNLRTGCSPRCYPMQVRAAVTGQKLRRGATSCRWVSPRQWVAAAVLLAQFQLLCLAAFHHHALASRSQPASSTSIGTPDRQGVPTDESRSCPLCQFVRHNPTTPPRSVAFSAASLASNRISSIIAAKPLVASRVRLAGRDPPFSFQAS